MVEESCQHGRPGPRLLAALAPASRARPRLDKAIIIRVVSKERTSWLRPAGQSAVPIVVIQDRVRREDVVDLCMKALRRRAESLFWSYLLLLLRCSFQCIQRA
jgi:hypothetical protein